MTDDALVWWVTPGWATSHALRHDITPPRTVCGRSLARRPHWPVSTALEMDLRRCGQCQRRNPEETT